MFVYSQVGRFKGLVDDNGRSVSKERAGWGQFGALITTYNRVLENYLSFPGLGPQTSPNPHLLKIPFVSRFPH